MILKRERGITILAKILRFTLGMITPINIARYSRTPLTLVGEVERDIIYGRLCTIVSCLMPEGPNANKLRFGHTKSVSLKV